MQIQGATPLVLGRVVLEDCPADREDRAAAKWVVIMETGVQHVDGTASIGFHGFWRTGAGRVVFEAAWCSIRSVLNDEPRITVVDGSAIKTSMLVIKLAASQRHEHIGIHGLVTRSACVSVVEPDCTTVGEGSVCK